MDTHQKWEHLEEQLTDDQLFAAHVLTNYNGLNHEPLDYLADEFGIIWDEDEDEDEDA